MANTDLTLKVTTEERLWIRKSLQTQCKVLTRSLDREVQGSEIWHLRSKELSALNLLVQRF